MRVQCGAHLEVPVRDLGLAKVLDEILTKSPGQVVPQVPAPRMRAYATVEMGLVALITRAVCQRTRHVRQLDDRADARSQDPGV